MATSTLSQQTSNRLRGALTNAAASSEVKTILESAVLSSGGTGTCVSDAVTINKRSGVITTESKTTAAGATYTITLTNSFIAATSIVLVSVNVNAGNGQPTVCSVTPAAGSATIVVQNIHASAAFNTAQKLSFLVVSP